MTDQVSGPQAQTTSGIASAEDGLVILDGPGPAANGC